MAALLLSSTLTTLWCPKVSYTPYIYGTLSLRLSILSKGSGVRGVVQGAGARRMQAPEVAPVHVRALRERQQAGASVLLHLREIATISSLWRQTLGEDRGSSRMKTPRLKLQTTIIMTLSTRVTKPLL